MQCGPEQRVCNVNNSTDGVNGVNNGQMRERALVNQVMKMVHSTRAKVATFLAAEHTEPNELGHHFQGSRVQHNNNHTLKNHHQVTLFTHISLPLSHHQVRESVAVEKT